MRQEWTDPDDEMPETRWFHYVIVLAVLFAMMIVGGWGEE